MKVKSLLVSMLAIPMAISAAGTVSPSITVTHTLKSNSSEVSTLSNAPKKISGYATDHFTAASFGIPTGTGGTAYADFGGYSDGSGTYYAGNFCQNPTVADGNVIQMRSKNNNSGIVTCTTEGSCAQIVVYWNESTYDGARVLQFYGSDTPYSSPSDLYSTATQGKFLGEITYNAGYYTTVTINGYCPYIGVRSKSGAQYLEFIEFTWVEVSTAPSQLYVMGDLDSGSWLTNDGVKFTKSGNKFTANSVNFKALGSDGLAYFSFATQLSDYPDDWDTVNQYWRFGAEENDMEVTPGRYYTVCPDATGLPNAWCVQEGSYKIEVDFDDMTMKLTSSYVPVSSVSLNNSSLTMSIGQTYKLVASVYPSNATDPSVTWSSSNTSVASVSSNGTVTAKSQGTATITAKSGNCTATCKVTVKGVCEAPVFSVQNKTLYAKSSTSGATTHLVVTPKDNITTNLSQGQGLSLTGQYDLQAYATASGYDNSATAYGTLVWSNPSIPTSGNKVITIDTTRALIFTTSGSRIVVTGVVAGEEGVIYDINGSYIGSFTTDSDTTTIPYDVTPGEIYIITIGDTTAKVMAR